MIDPLYSFSGFGVGLLVGMTGVGGGSLMTPLLILLFGIHPSTAVGTDLLYAAATKTAGASVHGIAKSIDWRIVGLLALGSLPEASRSTLEDALPALADLAGADADASRVLLAVTELRQVDLGTGMDTRSFPFLPIISPRLMYLERLLFTLPRTSLRKR